MKYRQAYLILFLIIAAVSFNCSAAKEYLSTKNIPVGGETSFMLKNESLGGHEWVIAQNSDSTVLKFVKKDYSTETGNVGEIFRFKGLKKGTVELIFNYVSIEARNKILKTQTHGVTVR